MWHMKKSIVNVEEARASLTRPQQDEEIELETMTEPDTPRFPYANDGWFGSRPSLYSHKSDSKAHELKFLSKEQVNNIQQRQAFFCKSITEETDSKEEIEDMEIVEFYRRLGQDAPSLSEKNRAEMQLKYKHEMEQRQTLPFYKKIIIFFDLDLLRAFGYVNIAVGLTLVVFVEINFSISTPFILHHPGYTDDEVAVAMSAIAFTDLAVRFLIPLITAKFNFGNKTLFGFGIVGMCLGRLILTMTKNFYVMVGVFAFLGFNKAFRSVFWCLIIPRYVPLKRLPADAGLQLLMSGIFSMICGPVIGLIRDKYSYIGSLHFFNFRCLSAIGMWIVERIYRKYQRKNNVDTKDRRK